MEITTQQARPFFAYAVKRELRRHLKEGLPLGRFAMQAEIAARDEVLNAYRYCNVFREDDKTTRWIRHNIRRLGYGNRTLGALTIARWFNRIETLERLLPPRGHEGPAFKQNLFYDWGSVFHGDEQMFHAQRVQMVRDWGNRVRNRLKGVAPVVTGAYIIKTPAGMDKLDGVIWALERFLPDAVSLQKDLIDKGTLENAQKVLSQYPYMGPFMTYEVVTDLRHAVLFSAPDARTWASAGPGAARGLDRVLGLPVGTHKYGSDRDQQKMIALMRCLLQHSEDASLWPVEWRRWEMREVEHTLCEFDKYERARLGEGRPRQLYRKGE